MLQSSEIREIRKDFPFLELSTKEKPLVYLDSAATTQKPRQVIEAMNRYYSSVGPTAALTACPWRRRKSTKAPEKR